MTQPDATPREEPSDALLVFISYGGDRGEEHVAEDFLDDLEARLAEWGVAAWTDRELHAYEGPYDDIDRNLAEASLFLLVLTKRSSKLRHFVRREIGVVEDAGVPVIVLLAELDDPDWKIPVQAQNRQRIPFGGSQRESGWAKLRRELDHEAALEGQVGRAEAQLRAWRHRIEQQPESAPNFSDRIDQREREVAELRHRMESAPSLSQQEKIDAARERERTRTETMADPAQIPSVGEPPAIAPGQFKDRMPVLAALEAQLAERGVRLLTLIGEQPGIGKTALIRRLWDQATRQLGARLAGRVYMTADQFEPISAHALLESLIRFTDADATGVGRLLIESIPWVEKVALVLDALQQRRILVVIDAVEGLLDENREFSDPSLREVIDYLVQDPTHGVVILLAGQVEPRPLCERAGEVVRRNTLGDGLPLREAWAAFVAMAPPGWTPTGDPTDVEVGWLHGLTGGSPRALELAASTLAEGLSFSSVLSLLQTLRRHDGESEMATLLFARAFDRQTTIESRVAQALAVYRRPVPVEAVDFLLQPYLSGMAAGPALERLCATHVVRTDGEYFYLPPAESDFVLQTLPKGGDAGGAVAPSLLTQTVLMRRGAEWFASTKIGQPRRVGDLRAHLAEIELRVRAGEQGRAYQLMRRVDDEYLLPWGFSSALVPFLELLLSSDQLDRVLRIDALALLGRALMQQELPDRAVHALAYALSLRPRSAVQRASLRMQLTAAYVDSEDLYLADRASRDSLRAAAAAGWPTDIALALWTRADALARGGQLVSALRLHRLAAVWLDRERSPLPRRTGISIKVTGAWIHQLLGDYRAASEVLKVAQDAADESDLPLLRARCLIMQGQLLFFYGSGDPNEKAAEAASIALKSGSWSLSRDAKEIQALAFLRYALEAEHDKARSEQLLNDADSAIQIACRHRPTVFGWGLRGLAAFRRGNEVAARAAFRSGLELADRRRREFEIDYALLDSRGLVACGLALLENEATYLPIALAAYRSARRRTDAAGVVDQALLHLDQFGWRADQGVLERVRDAASRHPAEKINA